MNRLQVNLGLFCATLLTSLAAVSAADASPSTMSSAAGASLPGPAQQLQQCYNFGRDPASCSGTTFSSYCRREPLKMNLHRVLWSAKTPRPTQAAGAGTPSSNGSRPDSGWPLTVITTLTLERTHMLEAQCRSWQGPLVAAWWVPLIKASQSGKTKADSSQGSKAAIDCNNTLTADSQALLQKVETTAAKMFTRLEAEPNACALRVLLLTELVEENVVGMLAPLNALRNAALLATSTPLVATIDVDFLVSLSQDSLAQVKEQLLSAQVQEAKDSTQQQQEAGGASKPSARRHMRAFGHHHHSHTHIRGKRILAGDSHAGPASGHKIQVPAAASNSNLPPVVVLPAFEPCTAVNKDLAHGVATAFHASRSKTDAVRLWQDSEVCAFLTPRYPIAQNATNYGRWSTADSLYSITPEECYEPWFIAERTTYPMFDARYRGYGYNKQSQVAYALYRGHKFLVHPSAFIVHVPHPQSAAQKVWGVKVTPELPTYNELLNQTGAHMPGFPVSRLKERDLRWLLTLNAMTMFQDSIKLMKQGRYTPTLDAATQRCLATLPWWQQ